MPAAKYEVAKPVRDFVSELITLHHPHLTNVKIECVFRDKAKKKNKHPVAATVAIVNDLNAWLATPEESRWEMPEPFFALVVAKDEFFKLNETSQKALVDRYLYRMERDIDTGDLIIVPPDIEESTIVVHRHGLYNADLRNFVKAGAKHLTLLELMEDREDLLNMGDKVTINYGEDMGVEVTRAELLAALAKLDVEERAGVKLDVASDDLCEKVNSHFAEHPVMHDGEPITVTMSRG